jgi:hypothetical protein
MCGRWKVCHYLPGRVKREYKYVQDILKSPSYVPIVSVAHVVQAFLHFRVHTITQAEWVLAVEVPWQHELDTSYGHVRCLTQRCCHLSMEILIGKLMRSISLSMTMPDSLTIIMSTISLCDEGFTGDILLFPPFLTFS